MKIIYFALLILLSSNLSAIECKINLDESSDFSNDQILFLQKICNNYTDRFFDRYQATASINFARGVDDNASFDFKFLRLPDLLFYGGVSQEEKSAMAFTACHEIGHGLAGGAQSRLDREMYELIHSHENPAIIEEILKRPYAFSEGESDYFAVSCMKELFQKNILPKNTIVFSNDVIAACKNATDPKVCENILDGSKKALISPSDLDFFQYGDKHMLSIIESTRHPNEVCRLQTIVAAYFNQKKPLCWKGLIHRRIKK